MFLAIKEAEGSDEYVCLHSVGLANPSSKEHAEADFVIVGPAGVFCIEVKGGNVTRSEGLWVIGPAGNTYTSTEGPFAQAEKTTHPLRKYIEETVGLGRSDYLLGWGVAFPHIKFPIKSPEWDQRVVYDERDRDASFVGYVGRLEDYFRERRQALGRPMPPKLAPATVARIVAALRGDFDLVPTVRGLIGDSKRELVSLSEVQFAVLDHVLNDRNPRIICDGRAGTGKTVVAVEAARRLAAEGKSVLFLCFNNQLGRFLAEDIASTAQTVKTATVYAFMIETIRKAGLYQQLLVSRTSDDYYSRVIPEFFEKAAYELVEASELSTYDVIVVDEAQDVLNGAIMNSLELVLSRGFRNGRWFICLDSGAQSELYGRMEEEVLGTLRASSPSEFILRDNYRNPRAVVVELCEVAGFEVPICRRSLQSSVEYKLCSDDREQGRRLKALLVELLRDGVHPEAITILSGKSSAESCVTHYPPEIGKVIWQLDQKGPIPTGAISATSISAFKGLENEVIILTDVPHVDPPSEWARAALYVGMTRARSKLYMLVDEAFLNARKQL